MVHARTALFAVGALFLMACASLEHRPLDPNDPKTNAKNHGIRYYEISPYLIVYSDTNGNVLSKLEYLPDQTRLMSVTPHSRLAKLESELVFENGTLKSSSATVDQTAVAKAAITAVKTVAQGILAAANEPGARPEHKYPSVHIFKVVAKGEMMAFYGANSDCDIYVSIVPEKQVEKKEEAAGSGK